MAKTRGWCRRHYLAQWRLGNANPLYNKDQQWTVAKLLAYANPEGGCLIWPGKLNRDGYARVRIENRAEYVHRWLYQRGVGEIPDGLELDHLCRRRDCINFEHLEAVPHAENVRRGDAGKYQTVKTHCPKGHPYSGDNLLLRPDGKRRRCKACEYTAYMAAYYRKKVAP